MARQMLAVNRPTKGLTGASTPSQISRTRIDRILPETNSYRLNPDNLLRLPLLEPPQIYVPKEREKHRILPLDLNEMAVLELRRLPDLHADPFDRMLICQAIAHGMILLTPDLQIQSYPVNSRW